MIDPDRTLVESTRTRRARMLAAFLHGSLSSRRAVNTNVKRVLGSTVLAAVISVGCLGTGFVLGHLEKQRNEKAIEAFRQASEANPIPAKPPYVKSKETGLLKNTRTGVHIDPRTGFEVDPKTMLAKDPQGRLIDTRTGWIFDPKTGYYTDPASGVTVDPSTLTVVKGP
ncbi:hypothetical protein [Brevibacterium sp. Marseille-P9724]|uniref:hypothetical protein n=1 Tax=Brevibacterium sp. Marseille-P9724 TaxID=2614125 RepID=UPI00125F5643|nr:hypothetical protein [Brevibacterium sp. Marseille-P9724]